jgi:hypothetical protein
MMKNILRFGILELLRAPGIFFETFVVKNKLNQKEQKVETQSSQGGFSISITLCFPKDS